MRIWKGLIMSCQVLISYAHADREFAERLCLAVNGEYPVFWDQNLLGGDIFSKRPIREIVRTPVFLIVWSSASSQSEWVTKEYREAEKAKRKIIIPILLDDTPRNSPIFERHEFIDFRNWDGSSAWPPLSKLLQDIGLRVKNDPGSYSALTKTIVVGAVVAAILSIIVLFYALIRMIKLLSQLHHRTPDRILNQAKKILIPAWQ
jgi:predicted PurR-regulated permease PerM